MLHRIGVRIMPCEVCRFHTIGGVSFEQPIYAVYEAKYFWAEEAHMKNSLTQNISENGYPHITTQSDGFIYYPQIGEVILKSTMKLKLSSAARGI